MKRMTTDELRAAPFLKSAALIAVVLLTTSVWAEGFDRKAEFRRFPDKPVSFSLTLEELVSARDEAERYAPCDLATGDIRLTSLCTPRQGADAWDAVASVTNLGARARFLKLVFRAGVPLEEFTFWNGYLNQRDVSRARENVGDYAPSYLFPAFAAIGETASLAIGLDPLMLAARVDSDCVKTSDGEALELAFPVYLPPGDGFVARVALASAPARYLWHDVVDTWYALFPAGFSPLPDTHPGARSAEAGYLFWNPSRSGIKSIGEQANVLKKRFGGHQCWEWCYRPFARGGDWAITDQWSAGWQWFQPASLEERRNVMRARLAPAKYLNVAPMWYLNVTWTERDMAFKEFPGIVLGGKPSVERCWDQDVVHPVYSAGGTPYEKLFRESLVRIPLEYPDVKGIGWDSCFGNSLIPETHIGFAGTPCKSFRNGVPFAHEAVGLAGLLDFNHTHFTGSERMANAVNYKLVSPWMIAARADAGLYEGSPVTKPAWLWRLESYRARFGGRKIISWHSGCNKARLGWAGFDQMTEEEADDAHRQIMDDMLFLSYYWGVAVAPDIISENRDRLLDALPELIGLVQSGWHSSPACDAPEGVLVTRYGEGEATRLAVINPGYEERTAELFLPGDYWPDYPDGKRLKVLMPARQVMIVDPATGRARPAATRPPAPVKKVFGVGLMVWMEQSGLLKFVQKQ